MKKQIYLIACSIITFTIANYIYPYVVEVDRVIIGFPFPWLTIYDLNKNNLLFLTTHIHTLYLCLNLVLFYIFYVFLYFLFKIIKKSGGRR